MKIKVIPSYTWLYVSKLDISFERQQCIDEGRDISSVESLFQELLQMSAEEIREPENQRKAGELLNTVQTLPQIPGYVFNEPSQLEPIRQLRPEKYQIDTGSITDEQLKDRIYGAWLGRCIGCFLGKPLEGVMTNILWPFLMQTGQYPLNGYVKFLHNTSKFMGNL